MIIRFIDKSRLVPTKIPAIKFNTHDHHHFSHPHKNSPTHLQKLQFFSQSRHRNIQLFAVFCNRSSCDIVPFFFQQTN